LVEEISRRGRTRAKYATSIELGVTSLARSAESGDLVVTMGAGDITKAGKMYLEMVEGLS